MFHLSQLDLIAITMFIFAWIIFGMLSYLPALRGKSISSLMAHERQRWMLVMLKRELRIVDVAIITGLQQGAAFYASFSILAIGGCFALLGATDHVLQVLSDLPINIETSRTLWEVKILGLMAIYAYSFFKFGWSYRLFMYCSILVGGVPQQSEINSKCDASQARLQVLKSAEINTIASRHFNAGQRGVFFSVGYLGWFVSPKLLIVGAIMTLLVLLRRQYFSSSRDVIAGIGFENPDNA